MKTRLVSSSAASQASSKVITKRKGDGAYVNSRYREKCRRYPYCGGENFSWRGWQWCGPERHGAVVGQWVWNQFVGRWLRCVFTHSPVYFRFSCSSSTVGLKTRHASCDRHLNGILNIGETLLNSGLNPPLLWISVACTPKCRITFEKLREFSKRRS
ncbi:hypothetical protein AAG570_010315 [Ranatra chinensis]|uniref:Uncharacterized protein n=1 Tax=Ranatra chinensis TaxID=642074 RepID=A0ABD0ZAJ2_9HEMI